MTYEIGPKSEGGTTYRLYKDEKIIGYLFPAVQTDEDRAELLRRLNQSQELKPDDPKEETEVRAFRYEVLKALKNCWGSDFPTGSESIRAWLESEWRKKQDALEENLVLKESFYRSVAVIANMAAKLHGSGPLTEEADPDGEDP